MATRKTRRARDLWIRQERTRTLHGILGLFDRRRRTDELSEAQEWLWDRIVVELERRHRNTSSLLERCWCCYCVPPFPDDPSDTLEDRAERYY